MGRQLDWIERREKKNWKILLILTLQKLVGLALLKMILQRERSLNLIILAG